MKSSSISLSRRVFVGLLGLLVPGHMHGRQVAGESLVIDAEGMQVVDAEGNEVKQAM